MKKRTIKGRKVVQYPVPPRISTTSSLIALTIAFAVIDILSVKNRPVVKRVTKKNPESKSFDLVDIQLMSDGAFQGAQLYFGNRKIVFDRSIAQSLDTVDDLVSISHLASSEANILSKMGLDFEDSDEIADSFNRSSERACEVLLLILFLERYCKLDTDQDNFSFCYLLARSIQYLSDAAVITNHLEKHFGRYYELGLAWELALQFPQVIRCYNIERDKSKKDLRMWRKSTQDKARTRWHERKRHIESLKKNVVVLKRNLEQKSGFLPVLQAVLKNRV